MNIVDAIKSGKPFKRASWDKYHDAIERQCGYNAVTFELADITADDWELQEVTITLTSTQFWQACRDVLIAYAEKKQLSWMGPAGTTSVLPEIIFQSTYGDLARELGLE